MSLTNPKKVITEERLAEFYQAILPYIGGVEVDNAISASSANPVENRVIKAALDTKAGTAVVSKAANGLVPQLPDELTTTKFLRQDGTWEVPAGGGGGGHDMIPTPDASLTEADVKNAMDGAALEGGINDDVVSAWSLGNWSNVLTKRIIYNGTIAIGNNTIGTWLTDAQFEALKAKTAQERAVDEAAYGWWYDAHFVGLDNFDDYDLNFKLEPGKDALTLGGYMLDTDTGYICIKFGTYATVATNKVAVDVSIIKNNLSYSPQQQQSGE